MIVSNFELRISNFCRYFGVAIMSDDRLGCHIQTSIFAVAPGGNDVAQVSKPAVSPASKPAKCGAVVRSADLEIRDTADSEVCATC